MGVTYGEVLVTWSPVREGSDEGDVGGSASAGQDLGSLELAGRAWRSRERPPRLVLVQPVYTRVVFLSCCPGSFFSLKANAA